jgi:RecB family exonuclease
LTGLIIRGRMDRIDRTDQKSLRVIDYKFKFGASSTAQEKDLYRARGAAKAAALYFLLGKRLTAQENFKFRAEVEANFTICPRWTDGRWSPRVLGRKGLPEKWAPK